VGSMHPIFSPTVDPLNGFKEGFHECASVCERGFKEGFHDWFQGGVSWRGFMTAHQCAKGVS
jgi:hypothetical protein